MVSLLLDTPVGTRVVDVAPEATIRTIKDSLASVEGIDIDCIHCVARGRPLCNDDSIEILQDCELTVTFDLDGGAKGKKKKKKYTTPKHVAHKKKKVKLAILKYYRIEENTISKTRLPCIRPSCGKGVFLASHTDRAHCGKCGTTLRKTE